MLASCNEYTTFVRLVFSGNHLKNSGFTSSILSHEGDLGSFTDREARIFEEPFWCHITESEFIESDDNISFCHNFYAKK
jgi:hypothetical protein